MQAHKLDTRTAKPSVSVIVSAYNEEKYIGPTLKSILSQNYDGPFEIIVVSNGTTDNTVEVARKYTEHIVELSEPNLSAARNAGGRARFSDILVFLDADTHMTPTIVHDIVEAVEQEDGLCVGVCAVRGDTNEFMGRVMFGFKNFIHAIGIPKGGAGIVFCDRKTFEKTGGFNPDLHLFELNEFFQRAFKAGAPMTYVSAPVITSTRRYTEKGYFGVLWFWLKGIGRLYSRRPIGEQIAIR